MRLHPVLAAAAAVTLIGGRAEAAVMIYMQQVGPDVVMTGSGTISFSDISLDLSSQGPVQPAISPSAGFLLGEGGGLVDVYSGFITGPANFGSGAGEAATSGTGNLFGLDFLNHEVRVPAGYSGGLMTFSAVFEGQTLDSLGVTPGTYTWALEGEGTPDTVTLVVVPAPEPATLAVFGALAGCGVFGYRRRKARA